MFPILVIITVVIIFAVIIAIYQKNTNAVCLSTKRLEGKTVLVTGGTTGIGLEIATDLAHRGARVIVACPFQDEGNNAKKHIVKETGNNNVVFKFLDLGSLKSIREFTTDFTKTENRLDILINNAGVGVPGDFLTSDNLNFIMQVNYYGTFLLTILLLPVLKKSGTPEEPSRILLTTSVLHRFGQVDIDNQNRTEFWYRVQIYGNSKICLVLFANELTKRLKSSNVVINSVDPGAVGTKIFDSGNKFFGFFIKIAINCMFKTTWQGAQTTLHAALDKKAGEISGGYFKNCELSRAVKRAYCNKTSKVLWEESVRLVHLTEDELEKCLKSL